MERKLLFIFPVRMPAPTVYQPMPHLPVSQLYSVATYSVGMCEVLGKGKREGREAASIVRVLRDSYSLVIA